MRKIKEFLRKEPTAFLFSKMWRFSVGNRKRIVFVLILFLFSNLVSLLGPLIFSKLLNEIQRNGVTGENINFLLFITSLIIGNTLFFWIFHGFGRIIERINAFDARLNYRNHLLGNVLGMGLSWHGSRDSGDTIDKINKATNGLFQFSGHVFLAMEIVIRMVGTAVVLYFFNPHIGLFIVPFILLSFFTLFQFDKRLVKQYKELNKLDNKISAKVFDALSNVTSVIILNVRNLIIKNIKSFMSRPRKLYERNVWLNEWKWFTGSVFFDLLVALPLAYYLLYSFRHNLVLEIGTLSALYLYLSRMSEIFFTFGSFYEDIIIYKTSVQNAEEIEQLKPMKEKKRAINTWNEITLRNLTFTYEDSEHHRAHLDNLSLSFKRGERIAFIGESGSGKTTFLKVLHGLYPTAKASISFDNSGSKKTNFLDIELHTMLVPQEPELFSASIEENITFGVEYPEETIYEATNLAQFTDVINRLPRGLASLINEKGVNLSGGQKQRLALARALLFSEDKEILLLDESTSSVDPKNEALIYENIFAKFKDKTILASIHKMNLLQYFDRIFIFEKGSIVESGTFSELLTRNDTFRSNWEAFVRSRKEEQY